LSSFDFTNWSFADNVLGNNAGSARTWTVPVTISGSAMVPITMSAVMANSIAGNTTGRVETIYVDEAVDPAWSTRLDADLRSAAASLGAGDNVKSLDCRTTMCRITSRFPDIGCYNKFMDELASHPTGGDGMFSTEADVGPDGRSAQRPIGFARAT
jgi:hypothetical protein